MVEQLPNFLMLYQRLLNRMLIKMPFRPRVILIFKKRYWLNIIGWARRLILKMLSIKQQENLLRGYDIEANDPKQLLEKHVPCVEHGSEGMLIMRWKISLFRFLISSTRIHQVSLQVASWRLLRLKEMK